MEVAIKKELWHFTLDIRFELNNQILILWGSSGSGKTSVLQCIAGLLKPASGLVKINGQVLYSSKHNINISTRYRRIGYLFQNYALFPHMTVTQNVWYGLKAQKEKSDSLYQKSLHLLGTFGVEHLAGRYPGQLSGGEMQRVALARALAVKPQVLLLDEPFSALDKSTRLTLRRELKELHHKWQIPIVMVTHDEEEAKYLGDITIQMEKGRSQEINLQ